MLSSCVGQQLCEFFVVAIDSINIDVLIADGSCTALTILLVETAAGLTLAMTDNFVGAIDSFDSCQIKIWNYYAIDDLYAL